MIGNLLARFGFGGIPFLLPLLMQVALHYSAELSGLLLVPVAFGIVTVKIISLRLLRIVGYKKLLLFNTFLVGFALWSFMLINEQTSVYLIALLTFTFGFLISMQYSGMNSLAYADISADQLSSATSIISTNQQMAQSLGVAAAALLLRLYSDSSQSFELTPEVFHQTFFAMGLLTFLSTIIFTRLKTNDGYQMLTAPAQEKVAVH
jgi:MFS family permease